MKKLSVSFMIIISIICLSACGKEEQKMPSQGVIEKPQQSEAESADTQTQDNNAENSNAIGSKILITYFSIPEDVSTDGVDAVASASVVVKDGKTLGANEYIAQIIQQTVGGELFRIETKQQYPLDHKPLVDLAADEQDENARPELSTHVENMDDYNVVFIGYPNWWGDMPMPLYAFLDEYDFAGKTIVPFVSHGGSGFSSTIEKIKELEPEATVVEEGLCVDRDDLSGAENDIKEWAEALIKQ